MVKSAEERILTDAPRDGRLAQAYLISAGSEIEAECAAENFLRRIFCEQKNGCGLCDGCRKFNAGNHVDLYLLNDESGIKKDQLTDLDEFLSKKSYEGGYRCVYIKGAHRMNLSVQNKLLKSIEEPPENVIFVLATNEPEQLLATTRSRCVAVKIRAKSRAEIRELLEGMDSKERIEMAAAQAMGSAAEAERLLNDESFTKARESAESILEMLCKFRNPSVFKMQTMLETDFLEISYQMILMLRDAMYYGMTQGEGYLMNPDREDRIKDLSDRLTAAGLSVMTEELLNAYQKKKTCQGLNAKLLAQTVLFKLVEVRNKCLK